MPWFKSNSIKTVLPASIKAALRISAAVIFLNGKSFMPLCSLELYWSRLEVRGLHDLVPVCLSPASIPTPLPFIFLNNWPGGYCSSLHCLPCLLRASAQDVLLSSPANSTCYSRFRFPEEGFPYRITLSSVPSQGLVLFGNIFLYMSIFPPRWGSVMVHFMNHLDWPKGFYIAGKTSFSDVLVRVFPEEISISI